MNNKDYALWMLTLLTLAIACVASTAFFYVLWWLMWNILFKVTPALLDNLIMIYFAGLAITTVFFIATVFLSRIYYYNLKGWFSYKFAAW